MSGLLIIFGGGKSTLQVKRWLVAMVGLCSWCWGNLGRKIVQLFNMFNPNLRVDDASSCLFLLLEYQLVCFGGSFCLCSFPLRYWNMFPGVGSYSKRFRWNFLVRRFHTVTNEHGFPTFRIGMKSKVLQSFIHVFRRKLWCEIYSFFTWD